MPKNLAEKFRLKRGDACKPKKDKLSKKQQEEEKARERDELMRKEICDILESVLMENQLNVAVM